MRWRFIPVICVAAAGVGGQVAQAADMPVKALVRKAPPRTVVPESIWSGWYIGGHIGGGWTHYGINDSTGFLVPTPGTVGGKASGLLGGPQIGFNWQTGNVVFGVQGDVAFTDLSTQTSPGFPTTALFADTKWIATVAGRLGFAWGNVLVYGKGGAAWVRNHYAAIDNTVPIGAFRHTTRSGYVAGGGVEYAFNPSWSGFIEYDYVGLGDKTITLQDPVLGALPANVAQNIQMVKVGVNYRFASPNGAMAAWAMKFPTPWR